MIRVATASVTRLRRRMKLAWQRFDTAYTPPPASAPSPGAVAQYEDDPSDFWWGVCFCQECVGNRLCDYHDELQQRIGGGS